MSAPADIKIPIPGGEATLPTDPTDIGNAVGSALNPLSEFANKLRFIYNVGTWKRIGVGVLGAYLIYIAILLILAQSSAVRGLAGQAINIGTRGVVPANVTSSGKSAAQAVAKGVNNA